MTVIVGGFILVVLGMAILATRNVCHTSVVGKGEYAFWANDGVVEDLFPALIEIWSKKERLARMGEEASDAARDWTWQVSASKLDHALDFGLAQLSPGRDFSSLERVKKI